MLSVSGESPIRAAAMVMTSANIATGGVDCEQPVNLCAVYGLSYAVSSDADAGFVEEL
jgi:hypothetical protein